MDFLKKHYEKVTLAAALILLIVSAVLLALKVSALSTELEEAPRRAPKPELTAHTPLQIYSNAIQAVAVNGEIQVRAGKQNNAEAFIEIADPWNAQNLIRDFLSQARAETTKEVAHG